ncbi:MAG: exodeoxyribonuclease VII large subunit [Cyanobacteria bacterium SBLK]|nr:exodeoxyribonuclease VII large subunit [Cyanobacteria bacterium SBLK]
MVANTAFSVAELTAYIQDLLEEDDYLQQIWVVGEVTSARDYQSGLFFTLGDRDGNASIRGVVWGKLRAKLVQMPTPGEQVVALGSVRLYPKRGEYQLNAVQVLPAGEGLQALQYKQLRSRLEEEGLFDPERKRSLPPHPQIVAVVTSPTAAAWGDIQRTLKQRYPSLQVLLSPAIVQGDLAPPSIAKALQRVERDDRAELTVVARGGGATEDLSCFNDERVVRAIAACDRPVVTGIGHQRDESLADLVADFCAHTPTAAAEAIVPDARQLQEDLYRCKMALLEAVRERWDVERKQQQQRGEAFLSAIDRRFTEESDRLQQLQKYLMAFPDRSLILQKALSRQELLREKLTALDPQAVLDRGYAVLRNPQGAIIHHPRDLDGTTELTVQLATGQLKVTVTEILETHDQ